MLSILQMIHSTLDAVDAVFPANCNLNLKTVKQMLPTVAETPEDNLKKEKIILCR